MNLVIGVLGIINFYPKQYQQMEIDFDFDDVELVSIDDK